MTRVKGGFARHRKHVKIIKKAKGYYLTRSKNFKRANEAVVKAGEEAFAGRRIRRRDLRMMWISRINGALTEFGIPYSRFINKLKISKIELDRKTLAEMAVNDSKAFKTLVESLS